MDIDPSISSEFQDHLRQMNELLGQNNVAMATYLQSLRNASQSYQDNDNAIKQNTSANKEASQAVRDLTEADKAASREFQKQMNNMNAAISMSAGSLMSFGGALLTGKEGLEKYSSSTLAAGQAISKLAENAGALGAIFGLMVQVATKVISDAQKLVDQTVSLRTELTKAAGVLPMSMEQMADLANKARFSGEKMAFLGQTTANLGSNLVALGGTAGAGAEKFMKMADVGDEVRK